MKLAKENAMQIVTEISAIIGQHVNLMNDSGIIVASTVAERIGSFHQAAHKVVQDKLDILIIHTDNEYQGAKKGINLPVVYDDTIVGVVGVSGDYQTVGKYGQIIKKMTEILLLETYSQEQKKMDSRIRTRFLNEWLFEDHVRYTPDFIRRGARLGIDITLPRRVLAAKITQLEHYVDSLDGQRTIDHVNRTVRKMIAQNPRAVFVKAPSRLYCLLPDCDDRAAKQFARQVQERVEHSCGVQLKIGIDRRGTALYEACWQAQKALRMDRFTPGTICFYQDITLEIFTDEISEKSRQAFLHNVFRDMRKDELASWVQLLQVYYECNGSISAAADKLFIHKNTLQYKLKRLHAHTGYDPRRFSDAALYLLAIHFLQQHE